MPRKRYTTEQIINLLSQAEILINQGLKVEDACRKLQVTNKTYYRWRKMYGGMQPSQIKELKALKEENARLKRAVAELTLDKLILKEVAEGKY